jgi:hypothetical protein
VIQESSDSAITLAIANVEKILQTVIVKFPEQESFTVSGTAGKCGELDAADLYCIKFFQ